MRTCRFPEALPVTLTLRHGWLRRRGWTALGLVAIGAMGAAGCVAVEMAYLHSTSFVAPIASTSRASPVAGARVTVKVEDRREDVAAYEVGAKYNPSWGYEGSTIDLKNKTSLAHQVAEDAVALLREQGFRAEVGREVSDEAAEILVTIRIDVFNVLLILGQDVRLDGLFLMEAVQRKDSRRWADAVGARLERASSLYPSDAEFQQCFERLYATLQDKMRDRLKVWPMGFSSSRSD